MPNQETLNQVNPNPTPQEQGPNLVRSSSEGESPSNIKLFEAAVKTNKGILLIAEIIFILLLLFNYKLGKDLENMEKKLNALVPEVIDARKSELEIYGNYDKYVAYKGVIAANPKTQEKIALVYKATPQEVVITKLSLRENVLDLNLTAGSATVFAKLIISYLDTKSVDQIVLKGATFKPESNIFDFNIQVTVKKSL